MGIESFASFFRPLFLYATRNTRKFLSAYCCCVMITVVLPARGGTLITIAPGPVAAGAVFGAAAFL